MLLNESIENQLTRETEKFMPLILFCMFVLGNIVVFYINSFSNFRND